jgi:hypothetical protein
MTTNTILDEAEQRISSANTDVQATRTQIVESMRDEIGRQHYEQAKMKLEELERAITKLYRPFADRVEQIQQQTRAPLPSDIRGWLQEMRTICDTVPTTIRAGIEGWDRLTVPWQADGRTLDIPTRANLIYNIRVSLRNWDGAVSRLDSLKIYVENYIRDSGWPSSAPR